MCAWIDDLNFDQNGLIPAIIQDINTDQVLMLAYMNKESIKRTLQQKKACFWSRSRQKYWTKGETSGNFQVVKEIYYDCDKDALLIKVVPQGPACHTGNMSCFFTQVYHDEA